MGVMGAVGSGGGGGGTVGSACDGSTVMYLKPKTFGAVPVTLEMRVSEMRLRSCGGGGGGTPLLACGAEAVM